MKYDEKEETIEDCCYAVSIALGHNSYVLFIKQFRPEIQYVLLDIEDLTQYISSKGPKERLSGGAQFRRRFSEKNRFMRKIPKLLESFQHRQ